MTDTEELAASNTVDPDSEPRVPRRWTVAGWLDTHRTTVIAAGTAFLALISVLPIATTPYRSDDKVLHEYPDRIVGSGFAALGSALDLIRWMFVPYVEEFGRFFPGSAAWTVTVFTTFQSRLSYKVFLAVLVLVMIALVAALTARLSRSTVAPVVVIGLVSTLTLRNWFDGLDTFVGLLPLTVALTFVTGLVLIRGRGWPSAFAAGCIWTITLLTYEVAILLTPTLLVLVWVVRRSWRRMLPIVLPALCDVVLVLVLRSQATYQNATEAYTINLDLSAVVPTYVRQVASALPLAEQWFPGAVGFDVQPALSGLLLLVVGVPAALVLTAVFRGADVARWPSAWLAALLGASCWLLPPLLVAVTLRFQKDLPPGEGYVSVVWGYVGVAILLAVGWMQLARRAAQRPTRWWRLAVHTATGVLAVLCSLTVAQSATIAVITQTVSV